MAGSRRGVAGWIVRLLSEVMGRPRGASTGEPRALELPLGSDIVKLGRAGIPRAF